MPEREHTVELSVQGTTLDVWDQLDVRVSMVSPGSPFTVSLWWSDSARSTWRVLQDVCKEGADCSISIDGVNQIFGVIEHRKDSGGRDGGSMSVSGKSIAGILAEGNADPRFLLRGLSLADIFTKFLEPLGITAELLNGSDQVAMVRRPRALHIPVSTSSRPRRRHRAHSINIVDGWRAKPGQTIWALLDEACKRAGFLLWEAPFPDHRSVGLVVDVPAESDEPVCSFVRQVNDDGTYRGNILHASHEINGRNVPTEVTMFASNQFAAQSDARLRASLINEVRRGDFSIRDPIPRPWFRHSDSTHSVASAQREAGRMIATATSHHRVYECVVRGYVDPWEHDPGLYAVNTIAVVKDQFHNIHENMLIVGLNFHRSRKNGELTTVTMLPIGNLRVLPALDGSSV